MPLPTELQSLAQDRNHPSIAGLWCEGVRPIFVGETREKWVRVMFTLARLVDPPPAPRRLTKTRMAMTNPKSSQFTTTRRDIPAARRPQEARASALRPEDRPTRLEDRPSGVQRAAAPDAAATQEDEREGESEEAPADAAR